jgi:hypothetical protein
MLSQEEINRRLHKFNLTNDWTVFDDVPAAQHVDVLYPHVMVFRESNESTEAHELRRKEVLNKLFGPLT